MAVIKGRIRGHGRQLASYLLAMRENEEVRILDVDGMPSGHEKSLRTLLSDFSRVEQLTKSKQGLYHSSVNPEAIGSNRMTDDDWLRVADILGTELGFTEQRRAIVLHRKHGRTHVHIVWERYCHEKKVMLGIDHNFRKHDRARAKIEQILKEQATPKRNRNREELKSVLTKLWKQSGDGVRFVQAAKDNGYQISKGYNRTPYMAVDKTGRSFDLIRQLTGVKTKEVRVALKELFLPSEKEAIAAMRSQQHDADRASAQQRPQPYLSEPGKEKEGMRERFKQHLDQQRQQQQRSKGLRPR